MSGQHGTTADDRRRHAPDRGSGAAPGGPAGSPAAEPAAGTHPWVLRDYALVADGERGAVIGPRGDVSWLCAPRWDSGAVFAGLIGGPGCFTVGPQDDWNVWGGYYEDGTLIRVSRWITSHGVVNCREVLAAPTDRDRLVMLRRIHAVEGDARMRLDLDVRAGYGRHAMENLTLQDGVWRARSGPLYVRLCGAPQARPAADGGGLGGTLLVRRGTVHDVVLEISTRPGHAPIDPEQLWESTRRWWAAAVPDCADTAAPRDSRLAYAVLHGLTSLDGGMVAAATTSLPERAETGRSYDYRYAWIRDQCYAGLAVAAHGPHPLLERSVGFVADRITADGTDLRPAYTVDGGPVPDEETLPYVGYPGGSDRIGNRAGRQFQLDTFGEALQMFAAAARLGMLTPTARRAVEVSVKAVAERWREPDAGLWELEPRWWTHSRLSCVAGLRAVVRDLDHPDADDWSRLADRVYDGTRRCCLAPEGYWQRAADDPGAEAALLLPLARAAVPADDASIRLTRRHILRELTDDGYVYRFRHGDQPLSEAEGAFLMCGFIMALATRTCGRAAEAMRWFERSRSACGSPGLFAEEYDVLQRQLRGNLPQAFVHAMMLECAATFGRDAFPPV